MTSIAATNNSGCPISDKVALAPYLNGRSGSWFRDRVNWSVLQDQVGDSGRVMTDEEVDAFVATGDPVSEW